MENPALSTGGYLPGPRTDSKNDRALRKNQKISGPGVRSRWALGTTFHRGMNPSVNWRPVCKGGPPFGIRRQWAGETLNLLRAEPNNNEREMPMCLADREKWD